MTDFTYHVMKDTTEKSVIKLTANFSDSTQEANTVRIQANTLYGALNANTPAGLLSQGGDAKDYYDLQINKLWFSCSDPATAHVELFWNADTKKSIFLLSGSYEYNGEGNWITIPNNAQGTSNCKGDIGVTTSGMAANSSYTLIIELRKNNADYQRGQFNDPAAFNYGDYGITP